MKQREIAAELARLREELSELGNLTPALQQRIQGLGRSIDQLKEDLSGMRADLDMPDSPTSQISGDGLLDEEAEQLVGELPSNTA